jgi:hypothetical protein
MPSPKNKHSVSSPKSGNNYENWSAQEFASYLKNQHDLGQYSSLVIKHGITGKVAHTLSEKDLQEMGISSIGDRKRFQQALSQLKQSARKKQREEVLWQGTEEMWNSWWEACCSTCCGCCPRDASQYKLTGTHLVITQKDIQRCGPIKCCCGHGYHIDNVDLTNVTDADVRGVAPPCCQKVCCCGQTRDFVYIKTSNEGQKTLVLKKGEGDATSRLIMNQVEEAQQMERD